MTFKALTVLLLFCSSVVAQSDSELFDVLTSNRESIEQYAAGLSTAESDRSVITGWLSAQPQTVSGPLLDGLKRLREQERSPEQAEEFERWEPVKPTIWERLQDVRESRRAARQSMFSNMIISIMWGLTPLVLILIAVGFLYKFIKGFFE